MKVFLTGRPGSGKSTVFARAVELVRTQGVAVAGIATPEVRDSSGARIGFDVVDLATGLRAPLSRVEGARGADGGRRSGAGPSVGRYLVDIGAFESVARPALERPWADGSQATEPEGAPPGALIAIDEVGKMEMLSAWFAQTWEHLLDSEGDLLAVVGRSFIQGCRHKGQIIEVTPGNRDGLAERIARSYR